LKKGPNLKQSVGVGHYSSVVHVPLIVNWTKGFNLRNQIVNPKTEVEWTERVSLLNAAGRRESERVIVQKYRGRIVAPVCPLRQCRKSSAGRSHERLSIDGVKSVGEVNLQEGKLGVGGVREDVPQGVSHDFHSARTTNSKVAIVEQRGDFVFPSEAEALCNEAAKRIPAT
jgi:hypothetical protein